MFPFPQLRAPSGTTWWQISASLRRSPTFLSIKRSLSPKTLLLLAPLRAKLHVSTGGIDSDFDIKLIAVYPKNFTAAGISSSTTASPGHISDVSATPTLLGGYQQLVRGEPMRGKFRNSFKTPEPFKRGKVRRLTSHWSKSITPFSRDTASWFKSRAHGFLSPTSTLKHLSKSLTQKPATSRPPSNASATLPSNPAV
jgi:hypothetical protein